jgi:hypothetical protein
MPALLSQPQQTDGNTQPNPSSPPTRNGGAALATSMSRSRKLSNPTVKTKKELLPAPPPSKQPEPPATQSSMKKITRKSSKPIITWFQRKLAGTVRARRASDGDALRAQRVSGTRPSLKEHRRRSSIPAVPPLPGAQINEKTAKGPKSQPRIVTNGVAGTKRNTISLDGSDDFSSIHDGRTIDSADDYRSSYARESLWSPASLSVREADEDASVRPLPPSAPPSPSPSHSSSSYLSDPRTFASMAASTKPTTVLSVDLTGGMAHIAQAPPTPTVPAYRLGTHARSHSSAPSTGGSITFSALPPTSSPTPPSSSSAHGPAPASPGAQVAALHAPRHTTYHPRNNPRPSSPPPDDASMLTLASSAFAMPGVRVGANALNGRRSLADDSISRFSGAAGVGDSTSHFVLGEDDERLLETYDRDGDVDASVRALRPRSSRRGSWESEASGWSVHLGSAAGLPGTPSALKDRSLWTSASMRTGTRSVNFTEEDKSVSGHAVDDLSLPTSRSETSHDGDGTGQSVSVAESVSEEEEVRTPPANGTHHTVAASLSSASTTSADAQEARTPKEKGLDTPRVSSLTLDDVPPPMPPIDAVDERADDTPFLTPNQFDRQSMFTMNTDAQTDVFVSAPSTPAAVL